MEGDRTGSSNDWILFDADPARVGLYCTSSQRPEIPCSKRWFRNPTRPARSGLMMANVPDNRARQRHDTFKQCGQAVMPTPYKNQVDQPLYGTSGTTVTSPGSRRATTRKKSGRPFIRIPSPHYWSKRPQIRINLVANARGAVYHASPARSLAIQSACRSVAGRE
jgi:hypothetical protein